MSNETRSTSAVPEAHERLDSWKDIATYLKRDVSTVQRWEKREGMPVYRHVHDKLGSVYAFRSELDAWGRGRDLHLAQQPAAGAPTERPRSNRRALVFGGVLVGIAFVVGSLLWFQR